MNAQPLFCVVCDGVGVLDGELCPLCRGRGPMVPASHLSHARDPDSSRLAAASSLPKVTNRRLCLLAHASQPWDYDGLTDDEVAKITTIELHEARRRCSDLRNLGLLAWLYTPGDPHVLTGVPVIVTRKNAGGHKSSVSVITNAGRKAWGSRS